MERPAPPVPVGFFDGRLRRLRPLAVFAANHPFLCATMVLAVLGFVVSFSARVTFHSDFVR